MKGSYVPLYQLAIRVHASDNRSQDATFSFDRLPTPEEAIEALAPDLAACEELLPGFFLLATEALSLGIPSPPEVSSPLEASMASRNTRKVLVQVSRYWRFIFDA